MRGFTTHALHAKPTTALMKICSSQTSETAREQEEPCSYPPTCEARRCTRSALALAFRAPSRPPRASGPPLPIHACT